MIGSSAARPHGTLDSCRQVGQLSFFLSPLTGSLRSTLARQPAQKFWPHPTTARGLLDSATVCLIAIGPSASGNSGCDSDRDSGGDAALFLVATVVRKRLTSGFFIFLHILR